MSKTFSTLIKNKNMKKILSLFWFFIMILPTHFFAQQEGWVVEFPGDGEERGRTIVKSTDGNYAFIVYTTEGLGTDTTPGNYFVKIDGQGNTLVSKNIESPGYIFMRLHATLDGGFIAQTTTDIVDPLPTLSAQPLFIKLDANGNEEWSKTYMLDDVDETSSIVRLTVTSDGGYLISGYTYDGQFGYTSFQVQKTDANLNTEWTYQSTYSVFTKETIVELPTGEFVVGGTYFDGFYDYLPFSIKLDANGNEIWNNNFEDTFLGNHAIETFVIPDGSIMLFVLNKHQVATQFHLDNNGTLINTYNLNWTPNFGIEDVIQVYGGFILVGNYTHPGTTTKTIELTKTNHYGDIQWQRLVGEEEPESCNSMVTTDDEGLIGIGSFGSVVPSTYLFRTNSSGFIYPNIIAGNVARDEQNNCLVDVDEPVIANWIISAENSENSHYAVSDDLGHYEIAVDTGDYIVSIHPPNDLWLPCEDSIEVTLTSDTLINIDFPMEAIVDCSSLNVSTTFPIARPCFDNNRLAVKYCNEGTAIANNAYIEIEIDEDLSYVNSTSTLTSQNGNILTFDIGDVTVGECGTLYVDFLLDCETGLGETVCIESHIYPDTFCLPVNPNWNGAFLALDIECQDSIINFYIENIGTVAMTTPEEYIIIEDAILLFQSLIQLAPGEIDSISIPTNGATYRLVADQVEGAPGDPFPSVWVEGCGINGTGLFSLGFINQFLLGDNTPYVDTECTTTTSSFDPNDKQGFPNGFGDEHFIRPNTDLEYLIRFQNTGTDTAFTVVIRDAISPLLDITSIEVGASSHPYSWRIYGENILEFSFNNIMLPDSNINEAASHGFVEFKIAQKKDVEIGEVIKNQAGIYFDFNEPIITNETFHTIGVEFLTVSTQRPTSEQTRIHVYPNPLQEFAIFEMKKEIKNGLIEIYDISGRLAWQQKFNGKQFELKRNDLKSGIYFYKITEDGQAINAGKIIVN